MLIVFTRRCQTQCCSGPRLVLSLALNLIPSKSDQSLLPNWAICTGGCHQLKKKNQWLYLLIIYRLHLEAAILTSSVVLIPSACPPCWRILGIEVHPEFAVEFSWHEWLWGRFFTSRLAPSGFSRRAPGPNVFASWDHISDVWRIWTNSSSYLVLQSVLLEKTKGCSKIWVQLIPFLCFKAIWI